jgi:hypothetical protein
VFLELFSVVSNGDVLESAVINKWGLLSGSRAIWTIALNTHTHRLNITTVVLLKLYTFQNDVVMLVVPYVKAISRVK